MSILYTRRSGIPAWKIGILSPEFPFDEFIQCYRAKDRSKRRESKKIDRWKSFTYDELIARDKTNLDIFWLRDEDLEDTENLPATEVLAQEIVEQLEAALQELRSVEEVLMGNGVSD